MTKWCLGAVVAAMLALGAGRAEACGGGGPDPAVLGIALGVMAADVVLPLYDLAVWDSPSRGMGIFETVVMAPQVTIAGLALVGIAGSGELDLRDSEDQFLLGFTALTTVCFVHGVWATTRPERPRLELESAPAARVAVSPILTPGRAGMAGLGVSGLF